MAISLWVTACTSPHNKYLPYNQALTPTVWTFWSDQYLDAVCHECSSDDRFFIPCTCFSRSIAPNNAHFPVSYRTPYFSGSSWSLCPAVPLDCSITAELEIGKLDFRGKWFCRQLMVKGELCVSNIFGFLSFRCVVSGGDFTGANLNRFSSNRRRSYFASFVCWCWFLGTFWFWIFYDFMIFIFDIIFILIWLKLLL